MLIFEASDHFLNPISTEADSCELSLDMHRFNLSFLLQRQDLIDEIAINP